MVVDGRNQDADAELPVILDGGGVSGLAVTGAGGTNSDDGSQLFDIRLTDFNGALVVSGSYLLVQDSEIVDNAGIGLSYGAGASGAVGAGTDDTHGNRIAGNSGTGISVAPGAGAVAIGDNEIGLNPAGTAAAANGGWGVSVGTAGTSIFDNLISGNEDGGITVTDCAATGNTVIIGNVVGLNRAGTAAVPNGGPGIGSRTPAAWSAAARPGTAT